MIVGFTGTQVGMTHSQKITFANIVSLLRVSTLHAGDCVGADEEAVVLAREVRDVTVIGHPPDNPAKRAFLKYDAERETLPYLIRNHAIVEESEVLIATPSSTKEALRSGTWATIRYARKKGRPILIINPDGTINLQGKEWS